MSLRTERRSGISRRKRQATAAFALADVIRPQSYEPVRRLHAWGSKSPRSPAIRVL